MREPGSYAGVSKSTEVGAAWLVSVWDGDSDTYGAFRSQRDAERWLTDRLGAWAWRDKVNTNHFYYEWEAVTR